LKLEDEVGIILFDRIQKPILPTPEGKRFLEQAGVVVREHARLMQVKRGDIPSGEFRLGVIPTVASYLVPLFVGGFSREFPRVDLFIEELTTESILEKLGRDQLDGAILATPLGVPGLKEHPLYYEPFSLYLSPGHPLLKKKSLTAADLDGSEMWLLEDGHCLKSQVASFCSLEKRGGVVFRNVHFQSGSLDTLQRVVKKNKGYTMLPALMADEVRDRECLREFRAPIPTREVSFVYRRDHWKLDVIRAIEAVVMSSLPESLRGKRQKGQEVLSIQAED
jgi:LysR family hydrogen peroxide-inducible transcriptional activator